MIENKTKNDSRIKWRRMQQFMQKANADACLLSTPVNIYYATGTIFNGYFYLPVEGEPLFFVKRPNGLSGENIEYIRKPEQITEILKARQKPLPNNIMMESGEMSFNEYSRMLSIFGSNMTKDATTMIRTLRMIKTEWEIDQFLISARKHEKTYSMIPQCYRPGMTDLELQYEIERIMRYNGSLGIFRAFGDMDIFMGSILAGDNAGEPSPFDFALGGAGADSSIPIGANGTLLSEGKAIMVDMAGNYTAYMTDMTRIFSIGKLPQKALDMHRVALDILYTVEDCAKPGMACSDIYETAIGIVKKHSLEDSFMGSRQQARFIGHGIGLHINEAPVLSPRSRDVLQEGMVIAIEPKFVVAGIGAVGIEDSYLITSSGLEKITHSPASITDLSK